MGEFQIFSVSAGKGQLAMSGCPGRHGRYDEDLYFIQDWQPSFVLSLIDLDEMERLGAARFRLDVPTIGARWLYFPVQSGVAPKVVDGKLWDDMSAKIRAALGGGGRVLIHGHGGCGRVGMVALRLLVEMGEPVMDALSRLRYVRHCAVETDAQFDWAAEADLTVRG